MIKTCKDCKFSKPDSTYDWELRCQNIEVNSKDAWALGSAKFKGKSAVEERRNTGFFAVCGMKGKLWEQKTELDRPIEI